MWEAKAPQSGKTFDLRLFILPKAKYELVRCKEVETIEGENGKELCQRQLERFGKRPQRTEQPNSTWRIASACFDICCLEPSSTLHGHYCAVVPKIRSLMAIKYAYC
jgi:hypothetical protein